MNISNIDFRQNLSKSNPADYQNQQFKSQERQEVGLSELQNIAMQRLIQFSGNGTELRTHLARWLLRTSSD